MILVLLCLLPASNKASRDSSPHKSSSTKAPISNLSLLSIWDFNMNACITTDSIQIQERSKLVFAGCIPKMLICNVQQKTVG